MRTLLIILVMVTLTNMAKANDNTVELETLSAATVEEMKQYNECVAEQGSDNSCINEVFGDIHN